MKPFKFAVLAIMLCTPIWGFAQNTARHSGTVSILKSYPSDVSPALKSRLDSTITATAGRFNDCDRNFKIVLDDSTAAQRITLDVKKAKLATKKQRYVAYLVNLIVPLYIPAHKVKSAIAYSDTSTGRDARPLKSSTHILIGSLKKREDKMLQKYADRLFYELNDIHSQLQPEFTSSIR